MKTELLYPDSNYNFRFIQKRHSIQLILLQISVIKTLF